MSSFSKRILTFMTIAVISGCGQTGKLYLPDDGNDLTGVTADNSQSAAGTSTIQATTRAPNKDDLEAALKSQSVPVGN